ncbi:MAG: hypothetical protein HKN50_04835 [Gammaproteobacteria bacterium]|nr:hypothetical protein [Gammaproteobacteria bacterium]
MSEALSAQQLLAAGASGALIVLFGALYAFFFAVHRLRPARYWPLATALSFIALATCSVVLAIALRLETAWQLAIAFILICYYFAPHAIWWLSVATHANEHPVSEGELNQPEHGGT